uniref:Uncharacterized protein n=1 Tax=Manihot esculenta TaxID=3983 RepID=A0A2C9VHL6_MANES
MFYNMVRNEMNPNTSVKVCKGMKTLACGALIHGFAIQHGIQGFIYVDNALKVRYLLL